MHSPETIFVLRFVSDHLWEIFIILTLFPWLDIFFISLLFFVFMMIDLACSLTGDEQTDFIVLLAFINYFLFILVVVIICVEFIMGLNN